MRKATRLVKWLDIWTQTILVMYSKRNLEFHHLNIEMQN